MIPFLTVFCSPLTTIVNGNVTYTTPLTEEGYAFNTSTELDCHPGYKLSASSPESRRHTGLGGWNGETQTCFAGIKNKILNSLDTYCLFYPVTCILLVTENV